MLRPCDPPRPVAPAPAPVHEELPVPDSGPSGSGRGREAFSSISGSTLRKSRAFSSALAIAPGPVCPLDTGRVGMDSLEQESYPVRFPLTYRGTTPFAFLNSIQGADLSQQFDRIILARPFAFKAISVTATQFCDLISYS